MRYRLENPAEVFSFLVEIFSVRWADSWVKVNKSKNTAKECMRNLLNNVFGYKDRYYSRKKRTNSRKSVSVVLLEKGVPNTELSVHMIPN